jgi:hypothetical protein
MQIQRRRPSEASPGDLGGNPRKARLVKVTWRPYAKAMKAYVGPGERMNMLASPGGMGVTPQESSIV